MTTMFYTLELLVLALVASHLHLPQSVWLLLTAVWFGVRAVVGAIRGATRRPHPRRRGGEVECAAR